MVVIVFYLLLRLTFMCVFLRWDLVRVGTAVFANSLKVSRLDHLRQRMVSLGHCSVEDPTSPWILVLVLKVALLLFYFWANVTCVYSCLSCVLEGRVVHLITKSFVSVHGEIEPIILWLFLITGCLTRLDRLGHPLTDFNCLILNHFHLWHWLSFCRRQLVMTGDRATCVASRWAQLFFLGLQIAEALWIGMRVHIIMWGSQTIILFQNRELFAIRRTEFTHNIKLRHDRGLPLRRTLTHSTMLRNCQKKHHGLNAA